MELGNPAWLLVWIAVPIMAVAAFLFGRFRRKEWDAFSAERLRGKLVKNAHPLPRWLAFGMLLAAVVAMVFAMARPQGNEGEKVEKTKGRNVMIALDLSRSMNVTDVNPDRLSQAKILIYELLDSMEGDRIGLVGFAGTPLLAAPLTIDHEAVRETVEQIDGSWVSTGGSDISSAVQMATQTLKETGQKTNALILISDGEENSGELDAVIADAESAGVVIFAVGLGTTDGGFVPHPDFQDGYLVDRSGSKVLSQLQPDVLKNLASETGGRYVIAGKGADIPGMVKLMVQGMDVFEMEGGKRKVVIEFYQWALMPGIFFLMASVVAGTRWRALPGMAACLMIFFLSDGAQAGLHEDAKKAFSEKRYDSARDAYRELAEKAGEAKAARYRLGEGVAAYEAEDYRGARAAFSAAMLSDDERVAGEGHEGMGNTLFQLGWLGLSGRRYPMGDEVPDMEVFDDLVREQLGEMGEAKVPEVGETNEFIRLDSILLNWSDAVRHYRSAGDLNKENGGPKRNGEVAMKYLVRLKELLEEEEKRLEQEIMEMEQMMQQQGGGDGEGEPQDGDGGEGECEGDGEGDEEGNEGGGKEGESEEDGTGDDEKEDGKGGEESKEDGEKGKGDEKKKEGEAGENGDKEGDGEGENPNETAEDRARRKLKENSDCERGPLGRAMREFRNLEKDW
jgi:Ca-activated chloride channel homolog